MPYNFVNPSQDQLFNFWRKQADLLPCIFPTRRYSADNIGPCYPGTPGRFHPPTQQLTEIGLGVLAGIASSGHAKTTRIDGLAARDTGIDQTISNMVGMCLKPVDHKVILIDFDFPIASLKDTQVGKSLDDFIESAADITFASRGNRERLMLVFRQSDDLYETIESRVEKVKKIVLSHKIHQDCKIEISLSNGGQANIAGLHKSGGSYLNHFPECDEIAVMDVAMFDTFIECAKSALFEVKEATTPTTADGRIDVDDAVILNEIHTATMQVYLDILGKVDKSFVIPIMDILPSNTRNLLKGLMTYRSGSGWYHNHSGQHLEGCRRDTSWQVLSDLSSIRALLIAFELPYSEDHFTMLVDYFAGKFQESDVVVDVKLPDGDWSRVYKWSKAYVKGIWLSDYIDNPRFHAVNEQYSTAFVNAVQRTMSARLNQLIEQEAEYA